MPKVYAGERGVGELTCPHCQGEEVWAADYVQSSDDWRIWFDAEYSCSDCGSRWEKQWVYDREAKTYTLIQE